MSILIKFMEMPRTCRDCPCHNEDYRYCMLKEEDDLPEENRPIDCPLVPVPTPHGRLIDARYIRDAIIQKWMDKAGDSHMYKCGMEDAYEVIRNAPTIIPAEEEMK